VTATVGEWLSVRLGSTRPSSSSTSVEAEEAWAVARRESNPRFEPDPNRSINPISGSLAWSRGGWFLTLNYY